jgi:hypothetical protein
MQMAEQPSEAVVAERLREYCNRLAEATRVLSEDSSRLAEVLIEILELAIGEAEMVGCAARPSSRTRRTRRSLLPLKGRQNGSRARLRAILVGLRLGHERGRRGL